MAYTKLWQKILTSSVWNEDLVTKVVWITMLALKDEKHMVLGSVGGVAHQARVSLAQCRDALAKLSEPDPDDSSKVAEGRRLIPVEGGWFVVNGEHYRNSMDPDERRAVQAAYMREYRARKQNVNNVITGNNGSSHVSDVRNRKECNSSSPLSPPHTPPLISPSPSDQFCLSASPKNSKSRPSSVKEVEDYVVKELGLTQNDAFALWEHWKGNGFTRDGRAIKDWRAVASNWERRNLFFPSRQTPKFSK